MRRSRLAYPTWASFSVLGAATALLPGAALAATPTYYADLPTFQADIPDSITDDYTHPNYQFVQSDVVMSGVVGETDYQTTGHLNNNIVTGEQYCAGCNGSFLLSFQTTSIGTPAGINAVGFDITSHDLAMQYSAFITFADGTTEDIPLPDSPAFWGVSAPERIVSIHVGLPGGMSTQGGYFQMDNLVIGEGTPEACPGASLALGELLPGSGVTVTRTGTTAGAIDDIDEENEVACWESTGAPEHVYRFVLPEPAWLQIDLENSAYDTKLALVDGCPGGDAFCAYNDDYGGPTSGFDCTNYAAGMYSVIVAGGDGNVGDYELNVTECSPCGNGMIDPGEICDDGNNVDDDGCVDDCVPAACGDGHVYVGVETCDDGNGSDTDACLNSCLPATCGDGFIQDGVEGCDDQNDDNTDACIDTCQLASCGDGYVFGVGEDCDDGNQIDGDGCSACNLDDVGETSSGGGEESSTGSAESTSGEPAESTGAADSTEGGESTGADVTDGGGSEGGSGGDETTTGGGGGDSTTAPADDSGGSEATGGLDGADTGCGCNTDAPTRAPWIAVVLVALGRRRRRTS